MSQLNFYVDYASCEPIIAENGNTYTKWYFNGDSILVGCIKPVSGLIAERDSLLEVVNELPPRDTLLRVIREQNILIKEFKEVNKLHKIYEAKLIEANRKGISLD